MKHTLISCTTVLFLAFGLVVFPQASADAARSALTLCSRVVIPSLFPFFVLSSFMNESGVSARLGKISSPLMSRVFALSGSGSSALVLGMIGGYPIGADCVRVLYQSGKLSKREAEHLLLFCNNSGPAFVLGAVGCGIFGSIQIGISLLVIHWLSAGLIGILLRFRAKGSNTVCTAKTDPRPFASVFCTSVKTAMMTMINVSAFIIFFAVFTELLHAMALLPRAGILGAVCTGVFELTSGIAALQPVLSNPRIAFSVASTLLGFGGFSVHAQTAALLSETDLSFSPYLLGKLAHATVACALSWIFAPKTLPTSAILTQSHTNWPGLAITFVALLGFFILFLFSEKRTGNR